MNYLIKQNFLPIVFHLIALAENIIPIMLSIAPTTKAVLTALLVLLMSRKEKSPRCFVSVSSAGFQPTINTLGRSSVTGFIFFRFEEFVVVCFAHFFGGRF